MLKPYKIKYVCARKLNNSVQSTIVYSMRYSLLLILSALAFAAFGQLGAPCLTDEINQEYLDENPDARKSLIQLRQELSQYMENPQHRHAKATKYIIPVVFHVIHQYGDENISKAQIEDQLRVMNEDFSRTNSDRTKTRSIYDGIVADMEIEFKLATIDPNGNCTEGITRTFSTETNEGDEGVKNIVRWPYRDYLNIWVVRNIAREPQNGGTILGYARLPYSTSASTDGIVIRSDRVGTIGTSNSARAGRTMTHEAGHWLGLLHPFQGGCGSSCSNSGDFVCDTPPVDGPSFGCPLGNNTCSNDSPDQLDMVENFMDYANGNCQNAFTKGQRDVCHFYLDRSVNGRASNASSSNITATGVNQTADCAPIADFYIQTGEEFTICQGGTVSFKDWSYNGDIESRVWTFEGGTPSTSTFSDPTVTYNTPGTYKVTLKVTNNKGSDQLTRDAFITVQPAVAENATPVVESLDNDLFGEGFKVDNGGSAFGWQHYTIVSHSGGGCIRANINANTPSNSGFELFTPNYDISELGINPVLSFRTAYARRSNSGTELMIVSASTDCGNSWRSLFGFNAFNGMETASEPTPNWQPSGASDWRTLSVDINRVAGASNVMFRFEAISQGGNPIYIDDISVGKFTLSVDENRLDIPGLQVYPNPSVSGSVNVAFKSYQNSKNKAVILDAVGRQVAQDSGNAQIGETVELNFKDLKSGVYYLHVTSGSLKSVKRIIVQ